MKIKLTTLILLCFLPAASAQTPGSGPAQYSNPVSTVSLPDPTVIYGGDGWFYLYATENIPNVPIMRSRDLVSWEQAGTAFTAQSHPQFLKGGHVWAPDISRVGGRYLLYYSLSLWGEEKRNGIGVATAASPPGPFSDRGALFISEEIGVTNSIDQFYIEDGGRKYLFWGSFRGLYAIELSSDGLSVKKGAQKFRVAGTAYEAVYIHKRDGYYYMFASIGSCCAGVNSTYRVVVGRSASLFGPYRDKQGGLMLENRHEVVLSGNDRFKGPGHNAEFVTDAAGSDWILYHAIDVSDPRGRKLMLDRVDWIDGWPVIGDGTPSETSVTPLF